MTDLTTLLTLMHPQTQDSEPVDAFTPEIEQGSDAWKESRLGRIGGSTCSSLMACNRKVSKMLWSDPAKIVGFGEPFYKIIYRMAIEKKYNYAIDGGDARNFKYGRMVEPFIIEKVLEKLPYAEYRAHGFIEILPGFFGASPDGELINKDTGKNAGLECKATMSTDTLYERTEVLYDNSHKDFWQTQAEMLALKTDTFIYANALPPRNQKAVLEGISIADQIPDVFIDVHKKSDIHCTALLERARIAGLARDIFIEDFRKKSVVDCVRIALEAAKLPQ